MVYNLVLSKTNIIGDIKYNGLVHLALFILATFLFDKFCLVSGRWFWRVDGWKTFGRIPLNQRRGSYPSIKGKWFPWNWSIIRHLNTHGVVSNFMSTFAKQQDGEPHPSCKIIGFKTTINSVDIRPKLVPKIVSKFLPSFLCRVEARIMDTLRTTCLYYLIHKQISILSMN